jgi:hypothetical protein
VVLRLAGAERRRRVAVTRDSVVFGVVLGAALATVELDGWSFYNALVELYREAGADEQVAAAELAWQRKRHAGRRSGG